MPSSLLAHLAGKFVDQKEVVATDGLAFVLRNSAAARTALEQLLTSSAGFPVKASRVAPQFVAGEESRPDLAVFGPKDELTALLEGKFWAGLTDAQPGEYLRRLREHGGRVLALVVPHERVTSISGSLVEASKEKVQFTPKEGYSVAELRDGVRLIVLSWRQVLASLVAGCTQREDHRASADLAQLGGLVEQFESEGFHPLTKAELTNLSVPRTVKALAALLDALVARGKEDGLFTLGGLRPSSDWTSAGRYVHLPHGSCWLGIDHLAWARFHVSPLWLWFPADDWARGTEVHRALQSWERRTPPGVFINDDDSVSVPLFITPGTEEKIVLDEILAQLRVLDAALGQAGLKRATSKPAPE